MFFNINCYNIIVCQTIGWIKIVHRKCYFCLYLEFLIQAFKPNNLITRPTSLNWFPWRLLYSIETFNNFKRLSLIKKSKEEIVELTYGSNRIHIFHP